MLIKCDKHTKEDLELWTEYEETDQLYINEKLEYKEQKAMKTIKTFNSNYISISWGKDSTVLAHLCHRANIKKICVWIIVKDIVNPYCYDVRDIFLSRYKIKYEEIVMERWHDGQRWRATKTLEKGFKKVENKYGKKYISGIRGQESGIRKIVMKLWGEQTDKTCRPLIYWKEQDIFSYLKKYDLPVHPNYGMLGGGRYDRKYLRVASLGIKRGDCFDKEQWEKEYYLSELNKIYSKEKTECK
jgi:phosphoadenosine phosphosulfate reductase